jgi:hypothetical protein
VQEIAILPLDVVDDPAPIETTMQANRNKPRLACHGASPLGYFGVRQIDEVWNLHGQPLSIG